MVSIISSWSQKFPPIETLSSTVVLFLLWCDDDTRLWSKSWEIFCCLSLFPFNSVATWQDDASKFSWSSKSSTPSGSITRGWREISSLEWPLLPKGQEALKKDWGVESTANWTHLHMAAFETRYFLTASFLTPFCRGFLAKLVLQTKVQRLLL